MSASPTLWSRRFSMPSFRRPGGSDASARTRNAPRRMLSQKSSDMSASMPFRRHQSAITDSTLTRTCPMEAFLQALRASRADSGSRVSSWMISLTSSHMAPSETSGLSPFRMDSFHDW